MNTPAPNSDNGAVYFDTYDPEIMANPYGVYQRLLEEAPLYHNDKYNFYALSRFSDVEAGLKDHVTFSSARGDILELIQANVEFPAGVLIFEDPPIHTTHRNLLARLFTPKRMNLLHDKVRDFCAQALDPHVGSDKFDFVRNLGAQMPIRVIGMLLGIPDEDLMTVRERGDTIMRTEAGKPMEVNTDQMMGEAFEAYIDWRIKNPSDDVMTELLNTEFTDAKGVTRKLLREEVMVFIQVLSVAGNETTNRLIGWTGKMLGDHPEQRRLLVQDRSLIPNAIEEVLRLQPSGPNIGRFVTRDVEYYGQTVPAGSAILFMAGAANRDRRRFENGDAFDVQRELRPHLSFGSGIHACIGRVLARLEGTIALEEVLKRFSDWEVDEPNALMSSTSSVRGWDSLPVFLR